MTQRVNNKKDGKLITNMTNKPKQVEDLYIKRDIGIVITLGLIIVISSFIGLPWLFA